MVRLVSSGDASIFDRDPAAATATPRSALVAGAGGGIGRALCDGLVARYPGIHLIRFARDVTSLPVLDAETTDVAFDITDEQSIAQAVEQIPAERLPDWSLVATGWLHDQQRRPEKSYRQLDPAHLLHAYRINAVGPALLLKHLLPRVSTQEQHRAGILSARVGSISDNRLGGWHAYRASKAALNMLIKNLAIETARKPKPPIIVGLQPGTTDSQLSRPFQRSVPPDQLQTPQFTAEHLLRVMHCLQADDSGLLFDFLGVGFAP